MRRALALACVLTWTLAAAAAPSREALRARWMHDNLVAIAAIRDGAARRAARATFEATLRAMRQPQPAARVPDVRAAAAAELAYPGRYHLSVAAAAPREKTLWERFIDWIRAQWDRLWNAIFGRVHVSPGARGVFGDAALAAFVLALIAAVARLAASLQIERRARRRNAHEALEPQRSARALQLRAAALAQRGEYAAAVRVLFLAALTALDLHGVVRDDASATVGDLRRALRARDERLLEAFDRVARPFVAAAYAEVPISGGDWERARDGCAELVGGSGAS